MKKLLQLCFCTLALLRPFFNYSQEGALSPTLNGAESTACIEPTTSWWLGGNNISYVTPTAVTLGSPPPPTVQGNIGTCNNYDFILKSNNLNTMWIKPSTKVGISESNPVAKFEVLETNPVSAQQGGQHAKLLSSFRAKVQNDFKHNEWVYRATSSQNGWEDYALHDALSVDLSYLIPAFNTLTWWERLPGQNIQKWGDGNSTYMILTQNRLTVENQVLVGTQSGAPNNSALCVNIDQNSNPNALEIFDQASQKINFKVKANGYAYAREINVMPTNITFPDYVFEKSYKLKTLNELETFVKQTKHLPNIPSAAEVAANGINVAEMQVKQMEKIEELFLYVIELKKENDVLKKKIAKLENKK